MPKLKHKQQGFTIVELLIVIVIIGILATISIVAYNNVNDKARELSAQSSAKQLFSKLAAYEVEKGTFPSTLDDINIKDSGSTTYQYRVDNSSNPKTWCSTVTVGSKSTYVSNSQATPVAGGCAGHGQGGVAAVTNLAKNPKPASGTGSSGGYSGYAGVGGVASSGVYNDTALGRTIWRITWTTGSTSNGGSFWLSDPIIIPGERYQISQTIRSSKNQTVTPLIVWINSAQTAEVGSYVNMGATNLVAGAPKRIGASGIAPTGAGRMRIIAYSNANKWEAGNTLDTWDTLMIKSNNTALYNYADGSSSNWIWDGAPNNSTSTGPPK